MLRERERERERVHTKSATDGHRHDAASESDKPRSSIPTIGVRLVVANKMMAGIVNVMAIKTMQQS